MQRISMNCRCPEVRSVPPMIPRSCSGKIRQIELRTRRLVDETLAGSIIPPSRGRGWTLTKSGNTSRGRSARHRLEMSRRGMNHPFVKSSGTRTKPCWWWISVGRDCLGQAISPNGSWRPRWPALAFSAIRNQDRVGLCCSQRLSKFILPRKGRRHVLRVIRDILYHQPRFRGTAMNSALEFAHRCSRTGPSSLSRRTSWGDASQLFGDCRASPAAAIHSETLGRLSATVLRQVSRRHDLVAVQITDPYELELPWDGWCFRTPKRAKWSKRNTADLRRRSAFAPVRGRRSGNWNVFRQAKVDAIQVRTDQLRMTLPCSSF